MPPNLLFQDPTMQIVDAGYGPMVLPPGILDPAQFAPQGAPAPEVPPVGPTPVDAAQAALPPLVAQAIGLQRPPLPEPMRPRPSAAPQADAPAAAPSPLAPTPGPQGKAADTFAGVRQEQQAATTDAGNAIRAGTDIAKQEAGDQAGIYDKAARERDELAVQQDNANYLANRKREIYDSGYRQAEQEFRTAKIDENRLWNDASTGKKVAWGIAIALSGLGQVLNKQTDKPNPVIQMLTDAIDRDVRLQMDQRRHLGDVADRKRGELDRFDKSFTDQTAAFDAKRAALRERVADQIEQSSKKYAGQRAEVEGAKAAAQLRLDAAGLREGALDREANRDMQRRGLAEQAAGRRESARQFDATQAEGKRRWEMEYGHKVGQDAFDNAMKLASSSGMPDIQAQKFAAEQRDKARALTIGGRMVAVRDDKGTPIGVDYAPFKQRDGSDFLAPTEKEATELRGSMAALDNATRLVDEMVRLREEHGHEADFVKSNAWQKMQTKWGDLAIEVKEIDKLGVLAGPDMGIISKQIGTSDPTEFRNITAGLREFRKNSLARFNSKMRAAGYTGEKYDVPELTNAGIQASVKNTPLQEDVASANNPRRFDPQAIMDRFGEVWAPGNVAIPGGGILDTKTGTVIEGRKPAPQQEASVIAIAAQAKNGDANAARALAVMAASNPNPRMRDLAKKIAADNGIDISLTSPTAVAGP